MPRMSKASSAIAAIVAAAALAAPVALARGGGHGGSHAGSHPGSSAHGGHPHHSASSRGTSHAATHQSRAYSGVRRDAHGRIARDPHAKEAFRKTHPCPSTGKTYGACPGWVVDHVQALKHGGADAPSNMQWQTRAAAKAKDRVE
jgi:hypothetical protein